MDVLQVCMCVLPFFQLTKQQCAKSLRVNANLQCHFNIPFCAKVLGVRWWSSGSPIPTILCVNWCVACTSNFSSAQLEIPANWSKSNQILHQVNRGNKVDPDTPPPVVEAIEIDALLTMLEEYG
jgi:hypothetical protein